MSATEKLILEKLDSLSTDIQEVKEEVILTQKEAREAKEIAYQAKEAALEAKEVAYQAKEAALEAKEVAYQAKDTAQQALEVSQQALEISQQALKTSQRTQLLLENEISKKIDLIGEGHDFLKMRLNGALKMEQQREQMGLEIINLRMDVDKIKSYLRLAF